MKYQSKFYVIKTHQHSLPTVLKEGPKMSTYTGVTKNGLVVRKTLSAANIVKEIREY